MFASETRFGTFPLNTDGICEAHKITALCGALRRLVRFDVKSLPNKPFDFIMTIRTLPGLGIISGDYSPFQIERTHELLADDNDDLILFVRVGPGVLTTRHREIVTSDNVSVMVSADERSNVTFSTSGNMLALVLPQAPLRTLLHDSDTAAPCMLLRNDAIRLIESYLSVMGDDAALASPDLCHNAVTHIYDLVALAIGAREVPADLEKHGLRAARLHAIKSDIADSLDRGTEISVGDIAARQRVTPRYVQMLFDGEGTTFTHFVLKERLARAYRLLTNPMAPDRGIAAIAYAVGFGDLSYFIRVFRRAYGATPSEIREVALHLCDATAKLCT